MDGVRDTAPHLALRFHSYPLHCIDSSHGGAWTCHMWVTGLRGRASDEAEERGA